MLVISEAIAASSGEEPLASGREHVGPRRQDVRTGEEHPDKCPDELVGPEERQGTQPPRVVLGAERTQHLGHRLCRHPLLGVTIGPLPAVLLEVGGAAAAVEDDA
jgi:hypothetical protein